MKPKKRTIVLDESLTGDRPARPGSLGALVHKAQQAESPELRRLHDKRVAVYRRQVERVGEALLRCALRSYASYDAAVKVNEKLAEQFGLGEESGVELGLVQAVIGQALRIEVAHILVSKTTIPVRDRDLIAERIIARMLPVRDGAPTGSQFSRNDLEKIVRDEGKRIMAGPAPTLTGEPRQQRRAKSIEPRRARTSSPGQQE